LHPKKLDVPPKMKVKGTCTPRWKNLWACWGCLSLMFNLKTSSKQQWKWYGWSSWFFFCCSSHELWLF
jgi:hypothetical protein